MPGTILPPQLPIGVGDRVVVRFHLPDAGGAEPTGGTCYGDVIGIVQNLDETAITLRKDAAGYARSAAPDDGQTVTIPQAKVVALKRVPPRPMARLSQINVAK